MLQWHALRRLRKNVFSTVFPFIEPTQIYVIFTDGFNPATVESIKFELKVHKEKVSPGDSNNEDLRISFKKNTFTNLQ